jgi:hypothetical protein
VEGGEVTAKQALAFVRAFEPMGNDPFGGNDGEIEEFLYSDGSPLEFVRCPRDENGGLICENCPCEGGGQWWKTPDDWADFFIELGVALAAWKEGQK